MMALHSETLEENCLFVLGCLVRLFYRVPQLPWAPLLTQVAKISPKSASCNSILLASKSEKLIADEQLCHFVGGRIFTYLLTNTFDYNFDSRSTLESKATGIDGDDSNNVWPDEPVHLWRG